jgi:hypothetical protein
MKHEDFSETMSRYHDGDLSPEECAQVERMCRAAVELPDVRNRFNELRIHVRGDRAQWRLYGGATRIAAAFVAAACIGLMSGLLLTPFIEMALAMDNLVDRAEISRTQPIEPSAPTEPGLNPTGPPMQMLMAWTQEIARHDPAEKVEHTPAEVQQKEENGSTEGDGAVKPLSRGDKSPNCGIKLQYAKV